MIKKLMCDNRGAAFVFVIIIMVVLMILGKTALVLGNSERTFSTDSEKKMQAEYIARSGADITAQYFLADSNSTISGVISGDLGKGSFQAAFEKPDAATILISSEGEVDQVKRMVALKLTKRTYYDVFTGIRQTSENQDEFDLTQLEIYHDADDMVNLEANLPSAEDILLSGAAESDDNIVRRVNDTPAEPVVVPDYSSFTQLSQVSYVGGVAVLSDPAYYIEDLSKVNNEYLTFDTGDVNGEMTMVVDSLDFGGSEGQVSITGGGVVHLYIRNSGTESTIDNPIYVNAGGGGTLFIYLEAGAILGFQSNADVTAYIYGPDATLEIQSDQTIIRGSMIGEIIDRGNPNGPHGVFYYVPLTDDIETNVNLGYTKREYYK